MKNIIRVLVFFLFVTTSFAQSTAGENAKFEYRFLVDMPTAGILKKGFVALSNDIMPGGIFIARMEVGVFEDVSFGISFGGANIIGSGSPKWYNLPGAHIRYKFTQESFNLPAFTIGFDSQGKGEYFDSSARYAVKSPGLFLAASKNFSFFGFLSFHGCLNYSLETKDGDNFIDWQIGAEKTIGEKVSVIAEYDFAFNDNTTKIYGEGKGYLNLGVRWTPSEGFTLGLDLRDMLDNKKWSPGAADRAIRLEFIKGI